MKNYKVKVKDAHPGMSFYHIENSGAYSGRGTYITNIVSTDEVRPFGFTKETGPVTVMTLDEYDNPGLHYVNEDDYLYPLGEWENVTLFHRIWWRIRQMIILLGLN